VERPVQDDNIFKLYNFGLQFYILIVQVKVFGYSAFNTLKHLTDFGLLHGLVPAQVCKARKLSGCGFFSVSDV
jgi:hypothetical protein